MGTSLAFGGEVSPISRNVDNVGLAIVGIIGRMR